MSEPVLIPFSMGRQAGEPLKPDGFGGMEAGGGLGRVKRSFSSWLAALAVCWGTPLMVFGIIFFAVLTILGVWAPLFSIIERLGGGG